MDVPDYLKPQLEELDKKIAEAQILANDPSMSEIVNEEIKRLEEEKQTLLESTRLPDHQSVGSSDPDSKWDNRNIILEIRGAAGGEEAKMWGDDLLRMYSRYAALQGWKVTPEGALSIKIRGKGVYGKLKYESGVHRVQRVPKTESSGRVHTSTATVAVLPELEDFDIHIDPSDVTEDFFRSGGHGGQNVNKVSSAVRLTHVPTGIVVTCQEERDQPKNRDKAMEKLRQILWEHEQNRQLSELSADRLAQIGTGMRNEKIRTYNFLQDRITDHRLDQNFHNIQVIMEGKLDEIIGALQNKYN
jgi:peptide chain release factor 1